uniref:Uncharacterized protein n=1 Tax=Ditylenchus dipsaci TaxID=166011 RepID=A0A915EGJ6_9BILA
MNQDRRMCALCNSSLWPGTVMALNRPLLLQTAHSTDVQTATMLHTVCLAFRREFKSQMRRMQGISGGYVLVGPWTNIGNPRCFCCQLCEKPLPNGDSILVDESTMIWIATGRSVWRLVPSRVIVEWLITWHWWLKNNNNNGRKKNAIGID